MTGSEEVTRLRTADICRGEPAQGVPTTCKALMVVVAALTTAHAAIPLLPIHPLGAIGANVDEQTPDVGVVLTIEQLLVSAQPVVLVHAEHPPNGDPNTIDWSGTAVPSATAISAAERTTGPPQTLVVGGIVSAVANGVLVSVKHDMLEVTDAPVNGSDAVAAKQTAVVEPTEGFHVNA
jgi:hypothetical protein